MLRKMLDNALSAFRNRCSEEDAERLQDILRLLDQAKVKNVEMLKTVKEMERLVLARNKEFEGMIAEVRMELTRRRKRVV